MRNRSLRRRLSRTFWSLFWLTALIVLLCNRWVLNASEDHVYTSWALLPNNDVGLVLGTSPLTRNGDANPQFHGRIQAAVQLYQMGKVRHLIVSGSNPDSTYNEPREMWRALTRAGVPPEAITMDFAGLRTFDSMARASEVFGLERCTVITQRYHAFRAVFLGKRVGNMRVVGYAAPGGQDEPSLRPNIREILARVKAVLDLYILHTRPRFLGEREPIELNPPPPSGAMSAPAPPAEPSTHAPTSLQPA